MNKELIVLCDEEGNPTGTAEKLSSHHATTPLHRAFSCYVFDDLGRFLITQRARSKKVWPGVWTNSVCGHPAPEENITDAIKRRLAYELGMKAKDFEVLLPTYRYATPPYNGIIENEYCPVYLARAITAPKPNPEEVEAFKWMSWYEYAKELELDSEDAYSWWCKDQLRELADHPLIATYAKPVS